MDTTAAAAEARVTIATIRTWCRTGAVAATKQSGRWIIEPASLTVRIANGAGKAKAMTHQPMYRVEEGSQVLYRKSRPAWAIVRTDGTPAGYGPGEDSRIYKATFSRQETAELYAKFYENTPAGYYIDTYTPRITSMDRSTQWLLSGSTEGDPQEIKLTLSFDWTRNDGWPEGTTHVDVLIKWARDHAEGAAQRIQDKAERDAIEAAETAVREAREQQLAELRRQKGTLATEKQVDYILQLVAAHTRTGRGGGTLYGPTDRAGIEEMSKADASMYIDWLKGDH
ncbi:hypothetical protein [Streptomyces sp. NBC_00470]|uniref:hypothetical protein n=1 Tax=Streptomyces sp. NBC_00470 TaxID=2975753 RepID=UPI002F9132BE